ncbi:unnamed protein product [marine sediment metagenome]|uniref:Uncharacterized protein n=1 Tax=marine sediment metagenome TaxID=412755 RepID=X1KD22_9ZZZZ
MANQPHESVATMSEERLRELHLYKELMTNEEARERYQALIALGASPGQARRWRHWSPNHFKMMIDYLQTSPEYQPEATGANFTELTA